MFASLCSRAFQILNERVSGREHNQERDMFGDAGTNVHACDVAGRMMLPCHRPAIISDLAERLRLGCVYEPQEQTTFGVLVTCSRPRSRGVASHAVKAPISAWWPLLAPSLHLVKARRPDGSALGWEEFATRYWVELEAKPKGTRVGAVVQIGAWLRCYPTVTLLSVERARSAAVIERTQRRILHAWLLGAMSWQAVAA